MFPDWTDESVSNFGNVLVECFAFVGDILTFYQDNQAREAFITTASLRRSLVNLAKLQGYQPNTASAARATLLVSIAAPVAGDIPIPNGTFASTLSAQSPTRFQVLNPDPLLTGYALAAGDTSVEIEVEHSEPASVVYSSNGRPFQSLVLQRTPYIDNSARVVFANGTYTQVRSFLSSTATDRHFTIVVDSNDRAQMTFGDGVTGAIPQGEGTIDYRIGGGAAGNVPADTIRRLEGSFTDEFGTSVTLIVTNPLKAQGGDARTSNARIAQLAQEQNRVIRTTIASEDFPINARRVPGVARAMMLTVEEDPAIPENTGLLYVIPAGGGIPSQALKDAVHTMVTVTYPTMTTFTVLMPDPVYKTVNISVQVHFANGYNTAAKKAKVKADILSRLNEFFAVTNPDGTDNLVVDFGANIRDQNGELSAALAWSDVFNVIRDTIGVRKIPPTSGGLLLNGEAADVSLYPKEFPELGTLTLTDADTGEVILWLTLPT